MPALLRLVPSDESPFDGNPGARPGHKPGNGAKRISTLLVVEDEIIIRLSVADYLRDCGYRVLEAATATEAQMVFRAGEPIELVFSDINMPGEMNGFALAQWVSREFPDVKVILTSGAAANAPEGRNYELFLAKPYSQKELAEQIKKLLAS